MAVPVKPVLGDALIFDPRLKHRAGIDLPSHPALDFLPRRLRVRGDRLLHRGEFGTAAIELGGVDQYVRGAPRKVDGMVVELSREPHIRGLLKSDIRPGERVLRWFRPSEALAPFVQQFWSAQWTIPGGERRMRR